MGRTKSGKTINPADAHRKQQRKRELKKNKEERKKIRLVTTANKDATKLLEELRSVRELEKQDRTLRAKRQGLEERLKKINEARSQLNLPPIDPDAVPVKKKKVEEVEYKWYHPTFNPHGPKKPVNYESSASDDSSDESSDGSKSESDDSIPVKREDSGDEIERPTIPEFDDLSYIPLPDGPVPQTEGQIYVTIELPETKDISEKPKPRPKPQLSQTPQQRPHPPLLHQQPVPAAYPGFPPFARPPPFVPGMIAPPMFPPPHMYMQPHPMPIGAGAPTPMMPPRFAAPPPARPYPAPEPSHQQAQQPQPAAKPTISAAPIIRDLQAESAKLVPAALRKKSKSVKAAAPRPLASKPSGKMVINAAPDVGDDEGDNATNIDLSTVPAAPVMVPNGGKKKTATDEYEEFMKQMKDLM
ncbi:hypothetical protein HDU85_003844 [Gaertneriomyces sp. JEL0708]|nr:hypothetical protein HDU85_003844 [Gaertneriomyces sp. JEL0708]